MRIDNPGLRKEAEQQNPCRYSRQGLTCGWRAASEVRPGGPITVLVDQSLQRENAQDRRQRSECMLGFNQRVSSDTPS